VLYIFGRVSVEQKRYAIKISKKKSKFGNKSYVNMDLFSINIFLGAPKFLPIPYYPTYRRVSSRSHLHTRYGGKAEKKKELVVACCLPTQSRLSIYTKLTFSIINCMPCLTLSSSSLFCWGSWSPDLDELSSSCHSVL